MFEHKNAYPVILVPGVPAYGDGTKLNKVMPYFGTVSSSVSSTIKSLGMECYTPSFGPLSGIWDRACELYTQIKGGTVDYGAAHSEKYGTNRYGKTYKGFVPDWGNGEDKKVTLIAHGFGVPVARLLVYLMANGSKKEQRSGGKMSPLFEGGHPKAVHALVSLAGVNDGTTFFQALEYRMPGITKKLALAGFAAGDAASVIGSPIKFLKDRKPASPHGFAIDIKKKAVNKEAVDKYLSRTRDNIFWELSLDGMAEFNKCLKINPTTYYLAYTGEVTKDYMELLPQIDTGKYDTVVTLGKKKERRELVLPDLKAAGAMTPSAALMATFKNYLPDGPLVTEVMYPNDGFVNTNTSMAPSTEPVTGFSRASSCTPGTWYQMPIDNMNHLEYIGAFHRPDTYRDYIIDMMRVICNLETV